MLRDAWMRSLVITGILCVILGPRQQPRAPAGLLVRAAAAAPAPVVDPLVEGQQALAQGWAARAFRSCMRAAEDRRQPAGRRAAALICQGRAALGLKWPAAAV